MRWKKRNDMGRFCGCAWAKPVCRVTAYQILIRWYGTMERKAMCGGLSDELHKQPEHQTCTAGSTGRKR